MNLDKEINEIMQMIGGIFIKKGIPCIPVNIEYIPTDMPSELQFQVVNQLIDEFDGLLAEYVKTKRKVHFYAHYADHFRKVLIDNSDGEILFYQKVQNG